MLFEELGLAPHLLRALAAKNYTEPTPIQAAAIPHVLAGRDVLGIAQTGTGKTAAFSLPILHLLSKDRAEGARKGIRALVLAPTRELASQIAASFAAYGRHARQRSAVVFGGVSQKPQEKALRSGVEIVVATPGRLLDLVNQRIVDLSTIEIFVLDEADRMLDMGFLPDLRRIMSHLPKQRQTMLFSATMPVEIAQLAGSLLKHPARVEIAPVRETSDLVEHSVYFVSQQMKAPLLTHILKAAEVDRALVFTRTKHGADRVAKQLNRAKIACEAIHGNKSQNNRQRVLASFQQKNIRVLVATDIAARGIDVKGISHVFNFDLPHEPETYVHRIGRTGRAGATGIAASFCSNDERKLLKQIERLTRRNITVQKHPEGLHDFAATHDAQPLKEERRPKHHGPKGGHPKSNGPKHDKRRRFGKPGGKRRDGHPVPA
jgi:ATP-dependent RNA helicase RhlE